jgi:DNA-binding response OmpR family regulator
MPAKILVIEDHPDTSQVITLLLGIEGITVITAADGYEGLRKANAERPDLIITDLMMPNLDGVDMIKLLRNQPEFAKVPVLGLTAYAEEMASKAIEAGADMVLVKFEDFHTLIDTVKALLQTAER